MPDTDERVRDFPSFTVRVPRAAYDKFAEAAKEDQRSLNFMVNYLIDNYLRSRFPDFPAQS